MTRSPFLGLTVAPVASLCIFGILLSVTAVGAPAIKKEKGWQGDEPRGVIPDARLPDKDYMKAENAKWRKLAGKASEEEKELLERIGEHPFWDGRLREIADNTNPWWCERIVEETQTNDVTSYYIQKNFRIMPGNWVEENLAFEINHRRLPKDATVDDLIRTKRPGRYFKVVLPLKKGHEPRNRLEVVKAWVKAMDEAWEKEEKKETKKKE
jgi:hypothetical protein